METCFQIAFQKSEKGEKGNKKNHISTYGIYFMLLMFFKFSLTFLLDGLCYIKMQGPKLCAHV